MGLVVQKFGGPRSATPTGSRRRAAHRRDRGVRQRRRAWSCRRWARPPTSCSSWPAGSRSSPASARDRHAAHGRRADLDRAPLDGDHDLGRAAISFTGDAGRDRHRHEHGKARIVEIRVDRVRAALAERQDRDRRRLPGRLDGARRSRRSAAAAPTRRRSRSPPRSTPTSARSTPTSTASTPPTRASCPAPRKLAALSYEEMLELAAARREGADAALGRVRPNARRADPRPLVVHARRRAPGSSRRRTMLEQRDHLRRRPRHVGGQDDDRGRARPARHRRALFRAARRRRASTST